MSEHAVVVGAEEIDFKVMPLVPPTPGKPETLLSEVPPPRWSIA